MRPREVVESPIYQGAEEEIYWAIDTAPWGGSPISPEAAAYDGDGDDVTSTVFTGDSSVADDVITLPKLHSLTAGAQYQITVTWTYSTSLLQTYFVVIAEE